LEQFKQSLVGRGLLIDHFVQEAVLVCLGTDFEVGVGVAARGLFTAGVEGHARNFLNKELLGAVEQGHDCHGLHPLSRDEFAQI